MGWIRSFVAATAVIAASISVGAGSASAAFGDLTFENCIEETTTPQNICDGNLGLLGPGNGLTIGLGGTSAYSVSFAHDRVTEYDRNPATGALTYVTCFDDVDVMACPTQVPGLNGAQYLAMTVDGTSLYVSSQNDDAIVEFARNTSTGALSFATNGSCYDDEDTNLEASCTNVKALDGALGLAVSPDGQSVYVVGFANDAIAHFDRNASGVEPMNGNLNQDIDNPCLADPGVEEDGCDAMATNFSTPIEIAISPDGESLYMSDRAAASTIAIFERDTPPDADPGDLDDDGVQSGDPGLNGSTSLAFGPEGDSLYVTGANDEAMVHYKREAGGSLDFQSCFEDNVGPDSPDCEVINGLADADNMGAIGPNAIAIPPDGRSLYLATASDSAIARFSRDPVTGALDSLGCLDDAVDGADDCGASAGVLSGATGVVPAGNSMLYVSATNDELIATFSRELDPVPPGPGPVTTAPVTPLAVTPMTARKKCKKGRKLKKGKCVKKKRKK